MLSKAPEREWKRYARGTHKRGTGRGKKEKTDQPMHVGQGSKTTHIAEYPPA